MYGRLGGLQEKKKTSTLYVILFLCVGLGLREVSGMSGW